VRALAVAEQRQGQTAKESGEVPVPVLALALPELGQDDAGLVVVAHGEVFQRGVGRRAAGIDGTVMWWVGDWWEAGHRYGSRRAAVEAEDWEGPAYQTCVNAGNVASCFDPNRRRLDLPWSYHAEVASLPEAEADNVLDWCEAVLRQTKRPPTIKALRERVKEVKRYLAEGWDSDQLERRALVQTGATVLATYATDDDKKPMGGKARLSRPVLTRPGWRRSSKLRDVAKLCRGPPIVRLPRCRKPRPSQLRDVAQF
jgi:hypothetical protein